MDVSEIINLQMYTTAHKICYNNIRKPIYQFIEKSSRKQDNLALKSHTITHKSIVNKIATKWNKLPPDFRNEINEKRFKELIIEKKQVLS